MTFTHPLARDAKVWSTGGLSDPSKGILVVITKLELDKNQAGYKDEPVERLSHAIREWIGKNPSVAADYLLMNRPKKWVGEKD